MGKIYQGILGGVSKKVGAVVGASWKGIPVVRSYQPNVSNPRTSSQVKQRNFFKELTMVASSLLTSIISPLWDRFAVRMSGYNAFISVNKKTKQSDGSVDFSQLVFAKGKMSATPMTSCTQSDYELFFNFDPQRTGRYQLPTDIPYGVIYDDTSSFVHGAELTTDTIFEGYARMDLAFLGESPSVLGYKAVLIFKRADGTVVSEQSAAVTITQGA